MYVIICKCAMNELWLQNKHCLLSGGFTHFTLYLCCILLPYFHAHSLLLSSLATLHTLYLNSKQHTDPLYSWVQTAYTNRLCLVLSGQGILYFTGGILALV